MLCRIFYLYKNVFSVTKYNLLIYYSENEIRAPKLIKHLCTETVKLSGRCSHLIEIN